MLVSHVLCDVEALASESGRDSFSTMIECCMGDDE